MVEIEAQEKIVSKKSGWAKWGSRIGHFLMYGGWILLLAVGLGVYIAISMLTQSS